MKKLVFLLILIFAFTACTGGQTSSSQQPDDSMTVIVEGKSKKDDMVEALSAADIFNPEKIKALEKAGITATVKQAARTDNITVDLTIEFTKGDAVLTVQDNANHYFYNDNSNVQYLTVDTITANVYGDYLLITDSDSIQRYSLQDLSYVGTLDLSYFEGDIIDIACHPDGFVALYGLPQQVGFAEFAADGSFIEKTIAEYAYDIIPYRHWGNPNTCTDNRPHIQFIDTDYTQVLAVCETGIDHLWYNNTAFDTENNISYVPTVIMESEIPQGMFYVIAGKEDESGSDLLENVPAQALIIEDRTVKQYVGFNPQLLMRSCYNAGLEYSINGNTMTCYMPDVDQTLTINFDNDTVTCTASQQMLDAGLRYKLATSATGSHSLYESELTGGGDVSYSDIYLVENATGKVKFIDNIGGMYGGSESCGFFSNGDVYTIGLDEFKVFTTDMSQNGPVFEMSKNFPLGAELTGDVYFRHLLAARRDPVSHSWTVLYNEAPYRADANDWYMDGDLGDNFYKSTYKVGILDPQGNLTRVYDTGEHVFTYAFRTVEMYMKPGDILHFEVLFKGEHPQLQAELDLKTGRYTCISGGYNEWID